MSGGRVAGKGGKGHESHEQALVVAHVRQFHPDVTIAAVPNGARRTRWERTRAKAEGLLAGYPDLVVDVARGGYFGLRIEMKRRDGKGRESKVQRDVRRRLTVAGYRCIVCDGAVSAIDELEEYLALPLTLRPSIWIPASDPLG